MAPLAAEPYQLHSAWSDCAGSRSSIAKPAELVMHVDGFPIVFKFQGNESAQTIRDTIFAEMQKFKVLKPTLVNDGSSNHIRLESK